MNTISIFFSNAQHTIGSLFESKITTKKVNMNLYFKSAFSITLDKTLLQTIIKELSALSKFADTLWLGVDNELSFIVVSENQSRMNITYKRSLTFTNNSVVDAEYSIYHFLSILKILKRNQPVITVSENKLLAITDSDNTYLLTNEEID